MSEFKCINCGEIQEGKATHSCPNCGYKMYETPYDRKKLLVSEIKYFLEHLKLENIDFDDIGFYRLVPKKTGEEELEEDDLFSRVWKQEDDTAAFPSFTRIRDYCSSCEKTEKFIERVSDSIEQIEKFIHTTYSNSYIVDFAAVDYKLSDLDYTIANAFEVLDIEKGCEFERFEFPKIGVNYSETPDDSLLPIVESIISLLSDLLKKIKRFIVINNIYGDSHRYKPRRYNSPKEKSHLSELDSIKDKLSSVLAKNYVVDLESDGTEEVEEMISILWRSIDAIMTLPVRTPKYEFIFDNGDVVINETICEVVLEKIAPRYDVYNSIIGSDLFVGYDEDEIFEVYDKILVLDRFDILGVNTSGLKKIGNSEKILNNLIGLSNIKDSITKIKAYALANKDSDVLNLHMCFYGNPGTGKTEVARIIAGILYENKILPTNKVVEVDRGGLVGQYVGETPLKTMDKIQEAMGGVLFIDEAYSLVSSEGHFDYGNEAVATLIKAMEDYRGKFCVILAGYKNQMIDMISSNPGFKSRIQFELDFQNYSRDDLKLIAESMLRKRKYLIEKNAVSRILDITDIKRKDPNFANAREIRNILDQVIMCQNVRVQGNLDKTIVLSDVNQYIHDANINLPVGNGESKKVLTGEEELERLIGLANVKRMVKKINAYAKRNKNESDFNLHMCFYGNPGTGKTEVARILSRILYDAGVLPEAKVIETDAQGLLGKFVGETGPKTQAKINDSMGGLLFIDEAYGLNGSKNVDGISYGDEAINVLLKEMEDNRGRFCVILAGYKEEIRKMISSNPGFESRIQFNLEFHDYTREELSDIALFFLNKKGYCISDDALAKILEITDYFRNRPNFANARTVRNILDQVIMNQNLRTDGTNDDSIIIDDVEDYLLDENIELTDSSNTTKIGFV